MKKKKSLVSEKNQIRKVVHDWAKSIRDGNLKGVLVNHSKDLVMYDVAPPFINIGPSMYKKSWDLFFSFQASGRFDLMDLEIHAGDSVAYCNSYVECGGSKKEGYIKVLLTLGLRKIRGSWVITHEHHSTPFDAYE